MFYKIYLKHIFNIYLIRFIYITLIFASFIFTLNILEELKFFNDQDGVDFSYPILLTILNLPSVLFEIFPFIILITTQFFYVRFQTNSEILIFKNNGINNIKIIFNLAILVFVIGVFLISMFHILSSNMKYSYLEFKNRYTTDNKYLAVINENGLWIKDILDEKIMIIHSEKIENNLLKNVVITTYDMSFMNKENFIANEAIIDSKIWKLKNAISVDSIGKKEFLPELEFVTNFDYIKINSLFSNLESLNIFQLYKQKKDFEKVGMSTLDIDIYLHKLFSLPFNLVIFLIISSIIMLNFKFNNSKSLVLITGILMSVVMYYIYHFFGLLGSNDKIPILIAIWLPNLILLLASMIGILNINEK